MRVAPIGCVARGNGGNPSQCDGGGGASGEKHDQNKAAKQVNHNNLSTKSKKC